MEPCPEKQPSKTLFKNQPRLSGFEIDKRYDDLRLMLVPYIEDFLSTDELFKDKQVSVEFSHHGVSSLLSFIEVGEEKCVLKIPLNTTFADGEATFLKAWESIGVATPHILREGAIADFPYILMSYVDASLLSDAIAQGKVKEDVFVEMGRTLRMMHTPKAEGYGYVAEGKPQYKTFNDWVESEDMQKRIKLIQENNLLTDEHGSISKVLSVLISYVEKNPISTYCHFDFGAKNILNTTPLTVIDPNPMLNNGVIDIGRTIVLVVSGGSLERAEKLKRGYFGEDSFDAQALQASIILNTYMKFPYWHKKNKTQQIARLQEYLAQTRYLLE